jgi:ankyrin repeat protein
VTPIHKALFWGVEHNYPMLVTWLLEEKGADVNVRDIRGYTALHTATSAEMITVLLIHDPSRCRPHGHPRRDHWLAP